MDTKALEQIGLTKGESKVYLALLELGETTTGAIIQKANISSSKVYEILFKLIEKGLASYTLKEKTKYFQPATPTKLLEYLNNKQQTMYQAEQTLQQLLPTLEAKQKQSQQKQTTATYHGFEGIKTVFYTIIETLQKGEEYYVFTLDEEVTEDTLKTFFRQYHTKRIAKGISVKLLSREENKKTLQKLYPKYKLSKRKFITRAFPTGVFIYKDHVMHFMYTPAPLLFVIQNNQLYQTYKEFFLELWNEATK